MLIQLRDTLAAEAGHPVRLDVLARRLDTEPTVVAAMLHHASQRGLLPDVRVAGGIVTGCGPEDCATPSDPGCRRCPLSGGAGSAAMPPHAVPNC